MAWAPAHIVVVDADGWRVYLDAEFGEFVFARLVAGPEVTSAHLATLFLEGSSTTAGPPVRFTDWYTTGVVIDETRRELRWFCSGSDVWSTSMLLRRLWLRLLAAMWPGWQIRWAYRGAEELAAYLEPDRYTLTREYDFWATQPITLDTGDALLDDDEPLDRYRCGGGTLVTVRHPDATVRAWMIEDGSRGGHPAWAGQSLLDRLPGEGWASARLAVPSAGLHVDVAGRWVGIWTTTYIACLLGEIPRLWPGWRVVFWQDRYEEHAAAAGDAVEVAVCDERAAVLGEALASGYRVLSEPAHLMWPPPGDHDPALMERAKAALVAAAAQVSPS